MFGKESKKKELVNNLGEIYQKIEREHQISPGDFPSLRKMQVWPPRAPRMYPLWALGCQGVRRWRGEAGGGVDAGAVVLEGMQLLGVGPPQMEAAESVSSTPPESEVDPAVTPRRGMR